jgi:beta-lactamase class A
VNRQISKFSAPRPAAHGKANCLVAVVMAFVFLAGCANKSRPVSTPAHLQRSQTIQDQLSEIAEQAQGRVGVFAALIETNERIASLNPQGHFPMQSVYKLPICMAVMKQVDVGKLRLDQKVKIATEDYVPEAAHSPIRDKYPKGTELTVNELLRFALSESDGTASDVLLKLAGNATVREFLASLPVTDIVILDTEKELAKDWQAQYRNSATPEAAVALLAKLYEQRGLSGPSRDLLLKYMTQSTPGVKRLKGLLPAGTPVAHKTGTSGMQDGITAATNDIGIVTLPNGTHLAIAVFVSDSPASETVREGVIAKLAKSIFDSVNAK